MKFGFKKRTKQRYIFSIIFMNTTHYTAMLLDIVKNNGGGEEYINKLKIKQYTAYTIHIGRVNFCRYCCYNELL